MTDIKDRHTAPSQRFLNAGKVFIPLMSGLGSEIVRQMTTKPLKTTAMILGMGGSVLVAFPATLVAGFVTWVGANSLWVWHGVRTNDWHLSILFGFYFITAVTGVISHGI